MITIVPDRDGIGAIVMRDGNTQREKVTVCLRPNKSPDHVGGRGLKCQWGGSNFATHLSRPWLWGDMERMTGGFYAREDFVSRVGRLFAFNRLC